MIIGCDLLGDVQTLLPAAHRVPEFTSITLKNGFFDHLMVSRSVQDGNKYKEDNWNKYTVINAGLDRDADGKIILRGGNIDYEVERIQKLRLKRRIVGSYDWITLCEKPVGCAEDLDWLYIDSYAKGNGTEYEYSFVPVVQDGEMAVNPSTVVSKFDGAVIVDSERAYHLLFDIDVTETTRNVGCGIVVPISSKYPYAVYGSEANYASGAFSGTILKYSFSDDTVDFAGGEVYRKQFVDWLTNRQSKILKLDDGRIWMINVTSNVQMSSAEHRDKVEISFDWAETGNTMSSTDMYSNGFIDCNIEGS